MRASILLRNSPIAVTLPSRAASSTVGAALGRTEKRVKPRVGTRVHVWRYSCAMSASEAPQVGHVSFDTA